ncbi:MAG TPA: glycosyltransferase family 4 protein [Acidimicrobiales bacterium]|nr:glycosyltransferase family 4 protein [Acidimicrobiales bacterium]
MNLGYYFHPICVFDEAGVASTEAHWGYFVRALAHEVGQVTFYAHGGAGTGTETLRLRPEDDVRCVDLGPRRQYPKMHFLPGPNLARFEPKADALDAMLVRAPTPLLPGMARRCARDGVPMVVLLVDDTTNWRPTEAFPWWRNLAVMAWQWTARRSQDHVARSHLMLAIAPSIVRRRSYKRSAVVPTTSLRRAELSGPAGHTRAFPSAGSRIRLLFTGRLFEEKGLLEFIEAVKLLVDRGLDVELELVGASYGDPTIETIRRKALEHGIADRVIESGFLEAGPELLAAYDRADIFVSPTWGEGSVTRTIKEAFARGVPVVSTTIRENTQFLEDGVHAVLVSVRDADALAGGIERVAKNPALRARITAAGFEWVQDYTNEHSAELVAGHIRSEMQRQGKSCDA